MKLLLINLLVLAFQAIGQPTQNIRGKVVDAESQIPLAGVRVGVLSDSTIEYYTGTDANGQFTLENIPVGRHTVFFELVTYQRQELDIQLTSGKELILNIALEESAEEMDELVVVGNKRGEAGNELAMISARRFSVEETDRYAGSRGDPARMASNYAGVQGADDSRNDIVVRGNSPLGLLYRFEGIDIPNPNHFAIAGSQGGPVSILNNKVLANSDFFTGAFPAEYGNSIAAVFDLKMRNGNNANHEYTAQLGLLGTELAGEGPISKAKGSSYLVNYRYSTFTLFNKLGIDIGTDAIPKYMDGSFKLSFPTKNNGHWGVFGVGGTSDIDIVISDQKAPPEEPDLYAENDRDQYFGTMMGVLGARYSKSLNDQSFLSLTLATTYEDQHTHHKYFERTIDSTNGNYVYLNKPYTLQKYKFIQHRFTSAFSINTKLNRRNILKYGFNAEYNMYDLQDSILVDLSVPNVFRKRWDAKGGTVLAQPYIQWKYKANDDLTFTSGFHMTYFELSNSLSWLEPRVGLKYRLNRQSSLSFGAGIHSQTQPFYTYLYHLEDSLGNKVYHNRDMDLTKSLHLIAGYNRSFRNNMRIMSEVYYQYLYNIPVEVESSSFSLVNQGSGFARFFPDSLTNSGTATNMGIEVTIEKFFDNSFFFLVTGSVYDSKYVGSDGVERNTDYNGQFVLNMLAGKEFKIKDKHVLSLSGKVTWAGGKRYGIVDTVASSAQKELIFLDEQYNDFQFRDYFRADLRVSYIINAKKVSHEIALDLVNITGQQNILGLTYTPNQPDGRDFRENYQLGFFPIFYYKINF